ncbi:MAG: hypothetical protein IPO40_10355 [Fibrobacteres bacterium]|nr:hypothetical protein [Fibrobacterota bacterium]
MFFNHLLKHLFLFMAAGLFFSCDSTSNPTPDSSTGPSIEQFTVVGSHTGYYWAYESDLELEGQIKGASLKSMVLDVYDSTGNLVLSKLYDLHPSQEAEQTFGPSSALRMLVPKDKWCPGKPSLRLTLEDGQGRTTSKTIQIRSIQFSGGPLPTITGFTPMNFDVSSDAWKAKELLQFKAICKSELGLASFSVEIRDTIGRTIYTSSPINLNGFSAEISPETINRVSIANPGTWPRGRYKVYAITKDRVGNVALDSTTLQIEGPALSPPKIVDFQSANFDDSRDIWATGMKIEFYGTITDDSGLAQVRLEMINKNGKSKLLKSAIASGSTVKFGPNETITFDIINPGDWGISGDYKIRLTAIDNQGFTTFSELNFQEISGIEPTLLAESDISLGGRGSPLPSFLDLDSLVAITSALAGANPALVDLCFGNTSDSKNEVRAPSADPSLNWATKNATRYHKVEAGSYAAAASTEDVQALFSPAKSQSSQMMVSVGDEIVIQTVGGNYRIIKVIAIKNSGLFSVEFSVKGKK